MLILRLVPFTAEPDVQEEERFGVVVRFARVVLRRGELEDAFEVNTVL